MSQDTLSITDDQIRAVIYRSCMLLDEERYTEYLALFGGEFEYAIKVYSPDLGKEMLWLGLNRQEMQNLLDNVNNHVRLEGQFFRHASVYSVERDVAGNVAKAITSVIVTHTNFDGVSKLYAAGRYYDVVDISGRGPLIVAREMRLETREFGTGSHIPM